MTSDWYRCPPPDANGRCSLGIGGVDYVADAVPHARVLIAEINAQMPATAGTQPIPLGRFAATITTDRKLPEDPSRAPDDIDRQIASCIAELIDDGDTLQLGVGSLGAAVLDALTGHRDLGFHTGMITDGLMRLVDQGVATGRHKELDAGMVVAGTALGSSHLYKSIPELPVRFLPTSYTHSPPRCFLNCRPWSRSTSPLRSTSPGRSVPRSAVASTSARSAARSTSPEPPH